MKIANEISDRFRLLSFPCQSTPLDFSTFIRFKQFFIKVIFTPNSKRTNQESVAVMARCTLYTYVCDAHGHRSNRIKVQLNKVLLQKILFPPCFLLSSLIQQTGCNVATSIHCLKQPVRLEINLSCGDINHQSFVPTAKSNFEVKVTVGYPALSLDFS